MSNFVGNEQRFTLIQNNLLLRKIVSVLIKNGINIYVADQTFIRYIRSGDRFCMADRHEEISVCLCSSH